MRGLNDRNGSLFSCVALEAWVPQAHPLRVMRRIVDAVLARMSQQFAAAHAPIGWPSFAAEKLLRALVLQALYAIRSERQLVDWIDIDLLFSLPRSDLGSCGHGAAASCGRWFVGLGIDDAVWAASTFAKNRDRFLERSAAAELLAGIVSYREVGGQMSRDHLSVRHAR